MVLKVKFLEQSQEIPCDFGEVHEIADAEGYGKGYNDGKKDGYDEGYQAGEDAGYGKGYEDGATESPAAMQLDALINGTIVNLSTNVQAIGDYGVYTKKNLEVISAPFCETVGRYALSGCSSLLSVFLPNVKTFGNYALSGCAKIVKIDFQSVNSIPERLFNGCSSLEFVYIPLASSIGEYAFMNCSSLAAVIISNNSICALSNRNAFSNTMIANKKGYIYVPKSLVDSYKTATNWATYANQIRAIEDYPEITGGTA